MDHEGLGFLSPKYHPETSLIILCDIYAGLVQHSQAQECLHINHKPFQVDKEFQKLLI